MQPVKFNSFLKKICLLLFSANSLFVFGKNPVIPNIDYVKNNGQWETPVLYKADLHGGWLFLEKDALTFKFIENSHIHPAAGKYKNVDGKQVLNPDYKEEQETVIKGHVYRIKWLNANPDTKITEADKQSYYNNYFIGNDQSKWQSNVGNYKTVYYNNIYPNIDFKIYSEDATMKSDYIIHKNGNPQNLKFQYDGVDNISVEENGKLKITTSINTVYELKPYAYQIINGKKHEVPCNYQLDKNILTFKFPKGFDKNADMVIDPTLVFSTYSGSFSDNWGSSATHDNAGNMFLGGIALGSLFPTSVGAFQTTFGGGSGSEPSDIAIIKFNATGTAKIYSTYLGGSSNELLASLLCTPTNELIAVLTTSSFNFPTTANAYDRTFNGGSFLTAYEINLPNGSDLAITKFNSTGTALIGSTYLGGSGNDGTNVSAATAYNYGDESRSDVAIDNAGNIYVTSTTTSTNLPGTTGKAQATNGGGASDGLLAKFNSNLSILNWATYFGGSQADASYSMAIDKNNNIFICGGTASPNILGRVNGLNISFKGGTSDGFVAKFDADGNSVLASTYLGTNDYDQAYIMDLDNNDNVYIFGQTLGAYPVSPGVYSNTGAAQFIHKLNNTLNVSSFSTVFGSINSTEINITPTALLVDVCGNIYAVGWGGNVNYRGNTFGMSVTIDGLKRNTDGSDFYLINLNANATSLKYATYFGENGGVGDHVDGGTSRFDKNGIVYEAVCASCGPTNSFPVTAGVIGPTNNSPNCNMAGFKFNFLVPALQIITATAIPPSGCVPLSVNFTYTATLPGTQFFWDFGDGTSSNAQFPSHTYLSEGTYTVRFILKDPANCNPEDSTTLAVKVLPKKSTTLNKTICHGRSITIGNQTFNTAGTFNIHFQSSEGCDSTVILNLTVTNIITNINRTICHGQSITIGNQTFNTPGTFTILLQTSAGCDSTVILNLTERNIITNINRVICEGDSIIVGNQAFHTTGNFSVILQNNQRCDSTVNLALTVNPVKTTSLNYEVCTGRIITIGNQSFSTSGTYTIKLQSSQRCDSIVNLTLLETDTLTQDISRTICRGQNFTIGNQSFNETGTYPIRLRATDGCDSIVNVHLIVLDTAKATVHKTICEGDSVIIGSQVFKEEGNYAVLLPSSVRCDSLVNLTLDVIQKKFTEIRDEICRGESVTIGTQTFTDSGSYTIKLTSSQNCDSLINLTIVVKPLPVIDATADKTSAMKDEQIQLNVLTTDILTYNWLPANLVSNAFIQNPTAFITEPTWFIVRATDTITLCSTIDSVFVDIEYLPCTKENIYIPNAFTPNGDGINDIFYVRTSILKSMHLEIYDRWGLKVFETETVTNGWDGTFKGQPAPMDAYGYYLKGECLQGEKITIKGNVTLFR